MRRSRWSDPARAAVLVEVYEAQGATEAAAKEVSRRLGERVTRAVLDSTGRRLMSERELTPAVQVRPPSNPDLPLEELLADRKRRFQRKEQHEVERKLIPVTVREDKPIGILHFGDPHVDDDGTDIAALEDHALLVRNTAGMYGASVGDHTNNWIGRLSALYGSQSTTESDAWRLAEWFIRLTRKWLYLVGGNHDAWSGAGDPLKWIARESNALYQDSEVRIALRFPRGHEVRVNCRHDFAGSSIYNPAHGPMKAAMWGTRDHILIAGDRHVSAYGVLKAPDSDITIHAIRVASYKLYDRYAREKGFRDQNLSPCVVTIIDPRLDDTHPDLIKPFWDPHEGADYLAYLRGKKRAA